MSSPSSANNLPIISGPSQAGRERVEDTSGHTKKSAIVCGAAALGLAALTVGLVATLPASGPAVVAFVFCAAVAGLLIFGDSSGKNDDQPALSQAELNRRYERNYMVNNQHADQFDIDDH
ncbi:hypothetical protein [Limnobacter parvus]|uniref:Transmembrane protein n=1 Tax=Limnobacter parvus TaxID=2939690 RepID=A0ABT1XLU3_9BURK|nr:hypothetical protein [Limnobacter parvus]MCR2747227.1 hypothetical protein [Limnobacter parvus]